MDVVKNVKRLVSESIKGIHQDLDPAPILYQFEKNLQELKGQVSPECREALEDYARKVWLLYDGFMTSVEIEDKYLQEVLQNGKRREINRTTETIYRR